MAFFGCDHAEGYGGDTEPPHVTFARITGREALPVAYCAALLHHYNPVFRTFAGRKLAELKRDEAYSAIEAALQHDDPRVRRAACDAISGYTNWGRRGNGADLPRDIVSERFVPHIEAILADEEAGLWELDGALWALSVAQPDDIRRNSASILRFAEHDEWYLRESAYWAVVGLRDAMTGDEFLFLADMFVESRHVYERSSYDGGIGFLLKQVRLQLDDETIAAYVQKLGRCTHGIANAAGYDEMAARHEAIHRVMMVLNRFENPPYELIAQDLAHYLSDWGPDNQHSGWLVTGSPWQPGLAQIAADLGEAGRPLIVALRSCDARIVWSESNQRHREIREVIRSAIDGYEREHGRIED
ncbi:MAG: HEAT repeat domain-containing protein [Planctomycetota bacterium]